MTPRMILTASFMLRMVISLLFLDGAVVIDEDECVVILRVDIALCSLVAGAKVALGM